MKKVKKIKVKSTPKKAVVGALISTGLSFLTGLAGNAEQKRKQREQQEAAIRLSKTNNIQEDNLRLADYKPEGEGLVDYYDLAKGGKLASPSYSSKGGELKPLSSDTEIAKGNKHNQSNIDNTSGIKLLDKNGKPFIEIEGDEVIKDGSKVYSDQTKYINGKTYAENAEILAKKKGKLESSLNKGDKIANNTIKRKLALIEREEDSLFKHQEDNKSASEKVNVTTAGLGIDFNVNPGRSSSAKKTLFKDTKFGKAASSAIPYLDNLTNAILTIDAPKVPEPILQKITPLKTKINVTPQLNDVTRAVDSSAKNIKNNSSDSRSARNEITSARLKGASVKAGIRANKENVEAGLFNQNIRNAQNITARNLAKINQFQDKEFAVTNDIQSRVSENAANAAGDFIDKRNFDATINYQNEQIEIAKMYGINGTSARIDSQLSFEAEKSKQDPTYYEEQKLRLEKYPSYLKKFIEKVEGNRNLATPNLN